MNIQISGNIPFKMPAEDEVWWLSAKDIRFDQPMFRDAIRAAQTSDPSHSVSKTNLSALMEAATGLEQITPAGLIFHVGRCGSTLLSNAVGAVNGTLALAEPNFISTLFKYHADPRRKSSALESGDYIAEIIRSFVDILSNHADHKNGVYLKFASWNTLLLAQIRRIWPNTPIAFVVREPLDVLDSILAKRVGWMDFYNHPGIVSRLLNEPEENINDMPFIDFIINMLTALYQAGLNLTENDLLLTYSNNRAENIEKLMAHFKLNPTNEDKIQIKEVSRYYSKNWHKGVVFTESMNAPKCILNKPTKTLIDQSGIREIYQKLETLVN